MTPLDREQFATWLAGYRRAWEARDANAALRLFTADATYRETPFDEPMRGSTAIHAYWAEVPERQRDIAFHADVLSVQDNAGLAHWRCAYTRIADGQRVELDGIFAVWFGDGGLCNRFEEWWHRRETTPAAGQN